MSHFSVLVIGNDIERQLAPFDENKDGVLEAKWDWYVIGGRWGGYFTLKPGKVGRLGEPSTFDKVDGDKRDHSKVDQARKGDIDFKAMQAQKAAEATKEYNHFATVTAGLPWPEDWESIRTRMKDDLDAAREFYWAQPLCAAMKEDSDFRWHDGPEEFGPNRDAYIARAARNAARTFAVVKNGVWYEKGAMGWFGMVANEQDTEQWSWQFERLIESLPDDVLLTIVDCHI